MWNSFVIYDSYKILYLCIGKDSAGQQMIFNRESEEINSVNFPDKAEKGDIPLTMIDS